MAKPNFAEDIIPVSEFRKKTSFYLDDIRLTQRSVVLTQNGHCAAIVLSPDVYEHIQYERDLFAAIARGEKEITEGKGVLHEGVFDDLFKRLGAKA